ncbi:MAG: hypothetical protein WAL37_01455 [Xanthobacteraceae bacterium]
MHARIRWRREDETWRPLFSQTLIDFEAGGIPMQDRNGVMPIFSYSNAQFARAPDHLCCYLAERCAEFIDGCVFASPIKRPLRSTQHRAATEGFQSGLAEPYRTDGSTDETRTKPRWLFVETIGKAAYRFDVACD